MNQPQYILKNGVRIRTHDALDSECGLMVSAASLAQRRPSAEGVIRGVVPGYGGDIYCVEHNTAAACYAAYCYTEFEVIP